MSDVTHSSNKIEQDPQTEQNPFEPAQQITVMIDEEDLVAPPIRVYAFSPTTYYHTITQTYR